MKHGDAAGREETAARAWWAMRTFVLELADKRKQATDASGMSYFRIKTLRRIATEGPVTLRALATALYADASYITLSVEYLVQRGLVTRTPNPADRRSKLVQVTDEGARLAARVIRIMESPPQALRDLPEEDLATLDRILDRLTAEGTEHAEGPSGR
ncbi:MarR family transcriptional regulator [Streptomyces sp. SB3404]|uniref:MarR family transcriptional regulator n=2 Tax=Streptomyces boncukensis TaxID=2711219 RepID=A0A6G4WY39_9ACTN|nr:MarR family transcriptional regulator [Streptomyces boncukensis]